MAVPAQYVVVIRNQAGDITEFNNYSRLAWEVYENDVGRCRFFIPYNDLKLSTSSVPDNEFSEIRIYRNTTLVWQGFISVIQDLVDGVEVYGETYLGALAWYGVRYNQEYSTTAIGTIITNEYDNVETRDSNFFTAKITQGTIEDPYIFNTTTSLTITRTLFNENFLLFLKQMVLVARAEMTPTWSQNAAFGISFSETTPTFTFSRNVGTERADVVLELDKEIADFNIPRDFRSIHNYVKGFAIASGPTILTAETSNNDSQGNWYRREFYPFFNNVTAEDDLSGRTDNFQLDHSGPRRDMSIKFSAGLAPFDGYSLGDDVKIRINRGRVNIDEFRRVIGMQVERDDGGVEQVAPILEKARA